MISTETKHFFEQVVNDTNVLISQLEYDLENADISQLPIVTLSPEDDSDKPIIHEDHIEHPYLEKVLAPFKNKIKSVVCDKANYCVVKEEYKDEIQLMVTVFDSLSSAAILFPLPIASVSAYCVSSKFLDKVCKCNSEQKTA